MGAGIVLEFRFDAPTHTYIDAHGVELPHTTGMLEKAGWIDDRWYRDEHSERGRLVHSLTADYDLGAVDVPSCVSRFRPYLLAHIDCLRVTCMTFDEVEQPWVHPVYRYGTRPDRAGRLGSARFVNDIKSGGEEKAHRIQTALQAIVLESKYGLPAEMWVRTCEYIDHRGKWKLRDHGDTKTRDFAEARRIINVYARR